MFRASRYVMLLTSACLSLLIFAGIAGDRGAFEPPDSGSYFLPDDTIKKTQVDDLPYPIKDRDGNFVTEENDNPFLLNDPTQIERQVEYDPETERYVITETLDGRNVKPPTYMSFDEYLQYEREQSQKEYWKERSESISLIEQKGVVPKLYVTKSRFGEIFGSNTIDIRPSGNIDLTFGGNVQRIDNPTLTENQRRNGGFDFDMKINMNVIGKIGDKVKINMNYNTEATFDFENQIKLNYEGQEDEIIKQIEAGNVTFSLPTTLITGSQSLFGLKTQLQFGRLTITNVYSQQKSRAENLTIDRGAQISNFEVFADQYDENRHFFLGHYFRDSYNQALANLPVINSLVNITRLDVWVTNRTGATENARDIVGFMDLGENQKVYNPAIQPTPGRNAPDNSSNSLYGSLIANPNTRSIDRVVVTLEQNYALNPVEDFEKTYGRKLSPSEYSFNPMLGYLSLNQTLYPDEVLAVAFEYTLNGQVFRVGEFAQDITQNIADTNTVAQVNVVFLKLLKGTSARPKLPIWDLMMKNIYPIGAFQVNQEDFRLNVVYQDPGGGVKRYIPEGALSGIPLIRLLELDRLNTQRDPQPDGVFDFVPGITINPQNGRVIFPVLEPFGDDLRRKFDQAGENNLANKYVYDQLYDSTRVIAQQFPQFNRFVLQGTFKSAVSNEISLGAFNVPQGSVTVTAGGQLLEEGRDYTIDYSLGRVKIINEGILNSGVPINVSYENNALFGFQTQTLFGTRLDYRVNPKLNIGGTLLHLRERPFTEKVNIGDDPIKNMQLGLDANYNTESQFLTWLVDKLPLYETKEPSSFSLMGEMAHLKPGHQRAIGKEGTVYIDDFEGTRSSYDLRYPVPNWVLASTPRSAIDRFGRVMFPEAALTDSLPYGFNRARLAWFNIDPLFLRNNSATPEHIANDRDQQSNHYVREVDEQEVFPNRTRFSPGLATNILTFNLSYYPEERGPYNFEATPNGLPGISRGVNPDGSLKDPQTRWGGIMRAIDNTDFEASNTEFIEFWVLDPFIYDNTSRGGELYINLGNISEDILKDSRKFFENGLQAPGSNVPVDTTRWGVVPRNQPITNAFDNDLNKRQFQDLGLDGLNDDVEREFHSDFLSNLQNFLQPDAYQRIFEDPSSDNYHYYRGDAYDQQQLTILERYKKFNNPQGNSPVSGTGQTISEAATNIPDTEDINRDFTLNENEEYFQYRIPMFPGMEIGDGFITDKISATVRLVNGNIETVDWFQFKIPINDYERKVGNIPDFRSIRFIRMFMTGFEEPVVLRFARLELVRNQWRRYLFSLLEPGEYIPGDEGSSTFFNVSAVNIEENSEKQPVNYVVPPGIERVRNLSSTNIAALQNEQALQVLVCDLADGDARAVFKTLNLDLRVYDRLQMFVHGSVLDNSKPIRDGEARVFIRLGSDFVNNYYEYEIPLLISPQGIYNGLSDDERRIVWPLENEINIPLDSMYKVKLLRNQANNPDPTSPFVYRDEKGNRYTVVGNPDLGLVKTAMLGVRNPRAEIVAGEPTDDGRPICVEVWFNELRLEGLDERGGWAALARMETKLADLGGITFSTRMHTRGYGQINQKVQERFRDDMWQYDLAGNIELSKFLPKKLGLRLPMYAGISQTFSTPEFDPYELDVPLNDKLNFLGEERRDYKRQVQMRETIKSFNLTNVRIVPQRTDKKIRFYHPSNLNATFAYNNITRSTAFIESDVLQQYRASLGYNFSPQAKYFTPFAKLIKSKSKYLALIKDFNLNFVPNNLAFSTDMNRQFGETKLRVIADELPPENTYDKFFRWDRIYGIKFNPTRSITLDFNAINNATIDEPPGKLSRDDGTKDSLWTNISSFGRTTRYMHNFSANYNAPLNKIPIIDWIQVRGGYTSSYAWTTGALYRDINTNTIIPNPLGNVINNTQDIRANGELNFKNFYDKFKLLKPYNSTRARTEADWKKGEREKKITENEKRKEKIDKDIDKARLEIEKLKEEIKKLKQDTIPDKKEQIKTKKKEIKTKKERIKKLKSDKAKIQKPESPAVSPLVRPFISLKRISITYSQNKGSSVPGYLPNTQLLGMSPGFSSPGWDFVFGYQPDSKWLDDAASKGWITADTNLNLQVMQFVSRNINVKGVVEPFRDMRIDLTLDRTTSENYQELFKKQFTNTPFDHLTPTSTGSYSVSYIAIKTLFKKGDESGFTEAFRELQDVNRSVISSRLAQNNPNSQGAFRLPTDTSSVDFNRYRDGYGPYNPDVIIPSFVAAYTGKDPNEVKLDPFDVFPLPNWRLTYTGLSNLPFMKKVVNSFNITHGYSSTYTVSSYISNLFYEGDGYFLPSAFDSLSNNFIPLYSIPMVVITEQLSPLIGIDVMFKNGLTTKFDYRKTRNLSMGLVDYQLSESRTTEVTVGLGYRLKGLTLPIKIKGKTRKLPNEINFRFDMSFRDNVTVNQRLDQEISEPTRGMKTIRVSPTIDYVINNRMNIRIFFDRNRSIPATSASFPITNTKAGITLRFALTP